MDGWIDAQSTALVALVVVYAAIPQFFAWRLGRAIGFCGLTTALYLAFWSQAGWSETIDPVQHTLLAIAILIHLFGQHGHIRRATMNQRDQASLVIQAEREREYLDELKDMDRQRPDSTPALWRGCAASR